MIDQADHREQASGGEPLLHRPKAVGIAFGRNHQQAIGRQAQITQARPIEPAELQRIALTLAPEHHASTCRLTAQKQRDQGKGKITNRGLTAVIIGHQFLQGGHGLSSPGEKRIKRFRILVHLLGVNAIDVGAHVACWPLVFEMAALDSVDPPSQPGEADAPFFADGHAGDHV